MCKIKMSYVFAVSCKLCIFAKTYEIEMKDNNNRHITETLSEAIKAEGAEEIIATAGVFSKSKPLKGEISGQASAISHFS